MASQAEATKAGIAKREAQRKEARFIVDALTVLLNRAAVFAPAHVQEHLADEASRLLDRLGKLHDAAGLSHKRTVWLREAAASWDNPDSVECVFGVTSDLEFRYGTEVEAATDHAAKVDKAAALFPKRDDAISLLYAAIVAGPWKRRWKTKQAGEQEIAGWLANHTRVVGQPKPPKITTGMIVAFLTEGVVKPQTAKQASPNARKQRP